MEENNKTAINAEVTNEHFKKKLAQTEEGKRLIPTLEQVEEIKNKLKGKDINTTITLQDCIDVVDGFINGTVTAEELELFGTRMTIRIYIPILEKMSTLMRILTQYEISAVESTEIKMIELYKHIFYTVVLGLYGQVQIDPIKDKELMTYENYDKLFPIFYQYIIGYCKNDYDMFMSMFNDCISWNGVKTVSEGLEQINSDKLEKLVVSNKELIDNLKENDKLVENVKDLLMANDAQTAKVIQITKESAKTDTNK